MSYLWFTFGQIYSMRTVQYREALREAMVE